MASATISGAAAKSTSRRLASSLKPPHRSIDQATNYRPHPVSPLAPCLSHAPQLPTSPAKLSAMTHYGLKSAVAGPPKAGSLAKQVRFRIPATSLSHSRSTVVRPWRSSVTANQHSSLLYEAPLDASLGKPTEDEVDGWTTVRYRRHRRVNTPAHSSLPTTRHTVLRSPAREELMASLRGKCMRCLSRGHFATDCRDPLKCLKCRGSGHIARQCPQRSSSSSTPTTPPPHLDSPCFPPLVQTVMVRPGDPDSRPKETFTVAASSQEMDRELDSLSTHAVVAWLGGVRPDTSLRTVTRAFCSQFGVRANDIKVAEHYPEDFFITFTHRHHRDAAVAQRDFKYGSIDFRVRQWQLPTHGDHDDFQYHVRLCLEGIPLHAWNESIAKRAVTRSCTLDYVEEQSLRKEDARTLNLWAWTVDPSNIPKVTWLTIVGRTALVHEGDAPPAARNGLTFRVIVHLDLMEDPAGRGGHAAPRAYSWRLGVVDGESGPRDRHDPTPPCYNNNGRQDDDDDNYDNDRHGRHITRGSSWSSRLFRSLSRAPKERERERSESRREHYRDRGYGTGGRRHQADTARIKEQQTTRGRSRERHPR